MEFLANSLQEHLAAIQKLLDSKISDIEQSGQLICEALASGRKVLLCGNGGSAADAQHIAAELVGCYEKQRRSWPAIALTTDTSALTAVSNDLGYEQVFARQVLGLAQAGDVLVQRGTIHNWINRGSEPCRIAFILIDAKPAEIGDRVLHAQG